MSEPLRHQPNCFGCGLENEAGLRMEMHADGERPAVTAKLEVNYRRPALLGREFEIQCWIERVDGRKLGLAGEVRDAGEVIADCTSLYVEVDVAHFLKGREAAGEGPSLPW